MARAKQGFSYYPWECGTGGINDRHIDYCMEQCGSDAFALYHFYLDAIYSDKEWYVIRDKSLDYAASRKLRIDRERVAEVLECLKGGGLIDEIEHDGKTYLTSEGIQKQFLQMRKDCKRTGEFEFIPGIWLLGESSETFRIIPKHSETFGNIPEKSPKAKQSRKKEIKENQIKAEQFESDSFDDFQSSSFSDLIIESLKGEGVTISRNTLIWIDKAVKTYDRRSIEEAIDTAIKKKDAGEVKNIVGYAKTVLEGWANGKGSPRWLADEERAIAEEKARNMKPAKISIPVLAREKTSETMKWD